MDYASIQRLRTIFVHRKVRSLEGIKMEDCALRIVPEDKLGTQINQFRFLRKTPSSKTWPRSKLCLLAHLAETGLLFPRLGLGLMEASGIYGSSLSDDERYVFLDEAYNRGERFWDTGKHHMGHGPFTSKSKSQC